MESKFTLPVTEPFRFEWPVDQHGYEIVEKSESEMMADPMLLMGRLRKIEDRRVLRRKGGPLRFYRPFEEAPALFLEVAHLDKTTAAIVEFANRFGLIGYTPPRPAEQMVEEPLWAWSGLIDALKKAEELLDQLRSGQAEMSHWIEAINTAFNPELVAKLSWEPGQKPRIVTQPRALSDALSLQFLFQITHGRTFKQCEQCSTWFPFGRGTGNRSRKRFCSDKCRVAAHRQHKEATS